MTADRDAFDELLQQVDRQIKSAEQHVTRSEQEAVHWAEWGPRISELILAPLQALLREVQSALRRPRSLSQLEREVDYIEQLGQRLKTQPKAVRYQLINNLLAYIVIPLKRFVLIILILVLLGILLRWLLAYLPEIANWLTG